MGENIRSACFDCPEHLAGVPKDRCASRCEKRFEPLNKLGPAGIGSVRAHVEKSGEKTHVKLMEDLNTLEKKFERKEPVLEQRTENEQRTEADAGQLIDINELIETICRQFGIHRNRLYQKDGSTKILRPLRVKLANKLKDANLTYKEIAPLIGSKTGSVSSYVNNYNWPEIKSKPNKQNNIGGHTLDKKDAETTNNENILPGEGLEKETDVKIELTIDFTDHINIYDDLVELAGEKLRKPEYQVLWMLIKLYEKGIRTFEEFDN